MVEDSDEVKVSVYLLATVNTDARLCHSYEDMSLALFSSIYGRLWYIVQLMPDSHMTVYKLWTLILTIYSLMVYISKSQSGD